MKEFEDWVEKNHGKDWLSKFNVYEINIAEAAFQAGQRHIPAEVREVMEAAREVNAMDRCLCSWNIELQDAIQKATEAGY